MDSNKIKSFKDLTVWQTSMNLVELVYRLSDDLPSHEQYGLVSQMRRAAISIPSNIAEGCKRNNRTEYRQFCGVAHGSAAELETQLLLAKRLYPKIEIDKTVEFLRQTQRMLQSLIKSLKI